MLFASVFQLKKLVVAIMSMVHSIVLFICNKKTIFMLFASVFQLKKLVVAIMSMVHSIVLLANVLLA
jgi:hypothetical protein